MFKYFLFLFIVFIPFAHAAEILTPEGVLQEPSWTPEEQQAALSKKLIRNTPHSSSFWIRLLSFEEPHTHNDHNLTVVVMRGKSLMHLGSQTKEIKEGDIVEIPKGTVHWVENKSAGPCLVYAVFTPILEGMDYQPA